MDSCLHRNDRIERIKATERFLDVSQKLLKPSASCSSKSYFATSISSGRGPL